MCNEYEQSKERNDIIEEVIEYIGYFEQLDNNSQLAEALKSKEGKMILTHLRFFIREELGDNVFI